MGEILEEVDEVVGEGVGGGEEEAGVAVVDLFGEAGAVIEGGDGEAGSRMLEDETLVVPEPQARSSYRFMGEIP